MSINSIVDFIQQGHVATIATISFFTAPILGAVTLVKFRFGSLRLAQGRTKRLYDIMNRKNGGHTASSGALQLATKDMLGVELPGDAIRFALQRDSPLTLLRNIKQAGLLVKFRADEQCFEDARIRPKLSFQHIFHIAMALIVAPYLGLILFGVVLKLVDPIAVAVLFTLDLIAMPALTLVALRADAARRLLNANAIYPLPHATRSSPSTPLTDAVKKPRTRRATKTDDHGSPQVGAAESPPIAV
ncbi:hypothetical protein LGN19_24140 [Burkholderia sp. AU30198]|uniref:hypothetical protein n=1 Tax=Burkholderia sp. AU30198 TaxID=2879627 RepID=UPI001CF46829|nr:hypothetical protein [Burkholderia sp. AU30198]MCA8296887.1 hypothetical protein [Burkholderia sp. AU30198]